MMQGPKGVHLFLHSKHLILHNFQTGCPSVAGTLVVRMQRTVVQLQPFLLIAVCEPSLETLLQVQLKMH